MTYEHGLLDGRNLEKCKNNYGPYAEGFRIGFAEKMKPILYGILKKEKYVLHVIVHEEYESYERYKDVKRSQIVADILDEITWKWNPGWCKIQTELKDINYWMSEGCNVVPRKLARQWQAEEKYKKMEEIAAAFAATCGQPLGSFGFLKALDKALKQTRRAREHWNSGEVRMEEWMDHRYAGGGVESYYDDLNYVNEQYSKSTHSLREIWSYIEKKFPLMCLRYREAKARKRRSST